MSVSTLLSGCGGSVGTGSPSSSTAASSAGSSAPPTATGTAAPTITLSGTPPTTVVAGKSYAFQPTASITGGTAAFSVSGLPSWASFNSSTGAISGSPTASNVGITGYITISASDGRATASLEPFKIQVTAAPTAPAPTGSASLVWKAPTLSTNGTPVTDLAGYRIYYGTTPGALNSVINVPGAGTTQYEISNLSSGTYYFAVAAYNSQGVESAASNEMSETI